MMKGSVRPNGWLLDPAATAVLAGPSRDSLGLMAAGMDAVRECRAQPGADSVHQRLEDAGIRCDSPVMRPWDRHPPWAHCGFYVVWAVAGSVGPIMLIVS